MPNISDKEVQEKWYDKSIKIAIYAMVVIVPIIFLQNFYTVFSAPKLLALRILTLVIILLWGAKLFIEEEFVYRKGKINVLTFIYAVVLMSSTLFSVSFNTSVYGAQGRFMGIFTLLNLLLLPIFIWKF